jgi:hypothetical protein
VYAWDLVGTNQAGPSTIAPLSEQGFPTSNAPSVNIKMALDPNLGKVGTGQLQFEYTVSSRMFWDLSMVDGIVVQQPLPPAAPIPNLPGNIFHGYNVTITPMGNVELGDPNSKCRQVNAPSDTDSIDKKPSDNLYWLSNDDQTAMHVCLT